MNEKINYVNFLGVKKVILWDAWEAQWVKGSAFGSGHGHRVLGSSPASGSLLSREPASPSLSACLSTCDFSLCQIKK